MNHAYIFWARIRILLGTVLILTGIPVVTASAQAAPEDISFHVSSYTCDQDPGNVSVDAGNIPDSCTPDTGASFTVATDDASFTDSCTTDTGLCTVQVPNEADVTVTEDVAPAGTTPRENPIHTQADTEFAGALFINLPVAAPSMKPTVAPPSEITFRITKYTCDQDPGNVSPIADNIPDDCSPTAGVTFEVTAQDGTVLGACTTDATGLCSLELPNEATVTVTEDTTTSPANTAPRENPITMQVVTEFARAFFVNLPVAVEPQLTTVPAEPTVTTTPVPEIGLPNTGAGAGTINDAVGSGLTSVAIGAAIVSGATAVVIRRQGG